MTELPFLGVNTKQLFYTVEYYRDALTTATKTAVETCTKKAIGAWDTISKFCSGLWSKLTSWGNPASHADAADYSNVATEDEGDGEEPVAVFYEEDDIFADAADTHENPISPVSMMTPLQLSREQAPKIDNTTTLKHSSPSPKISDDADELANYGTELSEQYNPEDNSDVFEEEPKPWDDELTDEEIANILNDSRRATDEEKQQFADAFCESNPNEQDEIISTPQAARLLSSISGRGDETNVQQEPPLSPQQKQIRAELATLREKNEAGNTLFEEGFGKAVVSIVEERGDPLGVEDFLATKFGIVDPKKVASMLEYFYSRSEEEQGQIIADALAISTTEIDFDQALMGIEYTAEPASLCAC